MEEESAQIGRRRELPNVFDVALPTQQRSGPERAVLGAMIDAFDPDPETIIQLVERERTFGIEVSEELVAHGPEATLDFPAAFGLVRTRMNNQRAERGHNTRQLWRAIDLRIVDVEAN